MGQMVISITPRQQRALQKKVRLAGKGSIEGEIRKAIDQYLAGPRGIEAAFLKLLEKKAPKDLPALLAKFKKTTAEIRRTMKQLKKERERPAPLSGLDKSTLHSLTNKALQVFQQADKANEFFFRPNRTLRGRTPFDLLTTRAGVKRVEALLGRIEQARHG